MHIFIYLNTVVIQLIMILSFYASSFAEIKSTSSKSRTVSPGWFTTKVSKIFFFFIIDQDLKCDFTIFNFKISNFP